jgi:hypothetical protein
MQARGDLEVRSAQRKAPSIAGTVEGVAGSPRIDRSLG